MVTSTLQLLMPFSAPAQPWALVYWSGATSVLFNAGTPAVTGVRFLIGSGLISLLLMVSY